MNYANFDFRFLIFVQNIILLYVIKSSFYLTHATPRFQDYDGLTLTFLNILEHFNVKSMNF